MKLLKVFLFTVLSVVISLSVFVACKTSSPIDERFTLKQQETNDFAMEVYDQLSEDLANMDNGCQKLERMWQTIRAYPDFVEPPVTSFGDVLTFGNGDADRFWKIFEGWDKEDWQGTGTGNEVRPYVESRLKQTIRLTHRYGVYVKLKFRAAQDSPYTGLFKDNDCILGRLSSAVPTSITERFTPAVSAKFFTDGPGESQVLIAQHDIGGQNSGQDDKGKPQPFPMDKIDNNFYAKYLSNRLSFENMVPAGFGAFSRFLFATEIFTKTLGYDPRELSVRHLANITPQGIAVKNPKGPRFIWLAPPSLQVKNQFAAMAGEYVSPDMKNLDFRKHFLRMKFNPEDPTSSDLPVLFKVYASDNWTYDPTGKDDPVNGNGNARLIGEFVVNSEFVTSDAADLRLFFRHTFGGEKMLPSNENNKVFHQDYPTKDIDGIAQWEEEMFTKDCALGAKRVEVENGTFLRSAIIGPNPRRGEDGELCAPKILGPRIQAKLSETKDDMVEAVRQAIDDLSAKGQGVIDYFSRL